jgi:hypothetical protein
MDVFSGGGGGSGSASCILISVSSQGKFAFTLYGTVNHDSGLDRFAHAPSEWKLHRLWRGEERPYMRGVIRCRCAASLFVSLQIKLIRARIFALRYTVVGCRIVRRN